MNPLVLGLGNPWRRDDGVGPCAVAALAPDLPAGVDVAILDGEPTRLLDAWADRDFVLVIDAVRAGAPAGTLHRLDALEVDLPLWPAASSHGPGIAAAVGLGRALDRLPDVLILIGIEPADTGHGDDFSDAVLARFDDLVDRAAEEVRSHVPE
jgi:hydrogenase maturation protease